MIFIKRKFNLVIVCRHNITRSAYIENYLSTQLKTQLPDLFKRIKISSAGIVSRGNSRANSCMTFLGKQEGFSMSKHHSRKLSAKIMKQADLVLVMSQAQLDFIEKNFPKYRSKADRILCYDVGDEILNEPPLPGEKARPHDMPDPTGREASDYREFQTLAHEECGRLLHLLTQKIY